MIAPAKCYPMKSDIRERDDKYVLEIDLPGFEKENIRAYVENGYLIVSAVHQPEKEKEKRSWLRRERYYGRFQRSFYIGTEISQEDLKASYRRGVLKIQIPKNVKEARKSSGYIQIA